MIYEIVERTTNENGPLQKERVITVTLDSSQETVTAEVLAEARAKMRADMDEWITEQRLRGLSDVTRQNFANYLGLLTQGGESQALEDALFFALEGVSEQELQGLRKQIEFAKKLGGINRFDKDPRADQGDGGGPSIGGRSQGPGRRRRQ